jgi:ABC-2 type transport system ATP-binding protein
MVAIETEGLSRTFGRCEAVRQLDLRVPSGSTFALIGPNGAGKTTTIKLLTNLVRPTRGCARVLGVNAEQLGPAEWRRIGYVSENQQLPGWMTPAQLLEFCRPFYSTWNVAWTRQLARRLDLDTHAPLRTLSRGTRMKVALLSALAFRPELVILDEPFSGLDPLVRDELVGALLEAPSAHQWTVLVSSHDVDEIERLADWVGFMAHGRLVLAEPVEQLLQRHRLVEVVGPGDAPPAIAPPAGWLVQGTSGRTTRFVDTLHDEREAPARIAALFPGAAVDVRPLGLREIFTTMARSLRPEAV